MRLRNPLPSGNTSAPFHGPRAPATLRLLSRTRPSPDSTRPLTLASVPANAPEWSKPAYDARSSSESERSAAPNDPYAFAHREVLAHQKTAAESVAPAPDYLPLPGAAPVRPARKRLAALARQ